MNVLVNSSTVLWWFEQHPNSAWLKVIYRPWHLLQYHITNHAIIGRNLRGCCGTIEWAITEAARENNPADMWNDDEYWFTNMHMSFEAALQEGMACFLFNSNWSSWWTSQIWAIDLGDDNYANQLSTLHIFIRPQLVTQQTMCRDACWVLFVYFNSYLYSATFTAVMHAASCYIGLHYNCTVCIKKLSYCIDDSVYKDDTVSQHFYPRPVLAFGYCHRLGVCVCQLFLVRTITHLMFQLESSNLDQKFNKFCLRSLLFLVLIDLDLPGQI